jgi:hypothetical protein
MRRAPTRNEKTLCAPTGKGNSLLISLAQKKVSGFWKRQGRGQLLHVRRELFVTPHAASAPTAFDHAGNRSNISATGSTPRLKSQQE